MFSWGFPNTYSRLLLTMFVFVSCGTPSKVAFDETVDTTTKSILFQNKKTFVLEDQGIYATNEFAGARLNGFTELNDSTAMISIFPENAPINNSPYYAFKIWSDSPKDYYLTFHYPQGFKHRYEPKIKVDNVWSVVDSSRVIKNDSLVTLRVVLDRNPIEISGQPVNSSKDVKNWFTSLLPKSSDKMESYVYGESKLGREMHVLDLGIGDSRAKDIVILLTRQHPPEVTGYFAFQSFLETILSENDLSNEFLTKYRVLAFPLMNPDGVDLGHWRHNAGGVDLNRDWSMYNQPEIKQTVAFINRELRKNKSNLILGLDFHSTWEDVFYTNTTREGTSMPYFITDWFKALEANITDYKVNEAAGNSTKPVSKGWFLYGHDAVGITYEIGDSTPQDKIQLIGKASAEQMMKILLNKKVN